MGFFEKLKQGLSKTASSISSVFTASELDDELDGKLDRRVRLEYRDRGKFEASCRWPTTS